MTQVLTLHVMLSLLSLRAQGKRKQTRPRLQFTSMAAAFLAIFHSSTKQSSFPLATSTTSVIAV